jgi:APA family basic amino acid/polyamine antiporter
MPQPSTLKRTLSLPLLTLYGLGTTIGAGIFVLIGKIAGVSGTYMPMAFLLASVLAGLSAFSFAELSSRYPESAGEAAFIREGLKSRQLAFAMGLCVVIAGLVSASAIVIGFSGYLAEFFPGPAIFSQIAITGLLGLLMYAGVTLSVGAAATITILEIGVLVIIIAVGGNDIIAGTRENETVEPLLGGEIVLGIVGGALLAFYAFMGFEDIVNVAEETVNPRQIIPKAIIATLFCTTALYIAISLVAIATVPISLLAQSDAPLTLIFERSTGFDGRIISAVALISVLNGALIQMIMASRVLYGLSNRDMLPRWVGTVSPKTKTPARAIMLCVVIVATLTSFFPIIGLAKAASIVTLTIFAFVNLSLLRIKQTQTDIPNNIFSVPSWVPLLGLICAAGLVVFDIWQRLS